MSQDSSPTSSCSLFRIDSSSMPSSSFEDFSSSSQSLDIPELALPPITPSREQGAIISPSFAASQFLPRPPRSPQFRSRKNPPPSLGSIENANRGGTRSAINKSELLTCRTAFLSSIDEMDSRRSKATTNMKTNPAISKPDIISNPDNRNTIDATDDHHCDAEMTQRSQHHRRQLHQAVVAALIQRDQRERTESPFLLPYRPRHDLYHYLDHTAFALHGQPQHAPQYQDAMQHQQSNSSKGRM